MRTPPLKVELTTYYSSRAVEDGFCLEMEVNYLPQGASVVMFSQLSFHMKLQAAYY